MKNTIWFYGIQLTNSVYFPIIMENIRNVSE